MPPPCGGCERGEPFDGAYDIARQCRFCYLSHNRSDYHDMWYGGGHVLNRTRLPLQVCQYRGTETGSAECATCSGNVRVKLFNCAVYGLCTLGKNLKDYGCCQGCKDYLAPPFVPDPTAVRHLLYHIYPVKGNGMWQWNVEQLRQRIGLFNGHRVVAIATDGRTDSFNDVTFELRKLSCDVLHVDNDPDLREVATFIPLFDYAQIVSDNDFILYAQAKGTTRRPESTARRWTERLYQVYMDYWPLVEEYLRYFPVVGAFKKLGMGWDDDKFRSQSQWHYSSSWTWYRAGDLFGQEDWRTIDQFWSGIEPYPSLHFPSSKAASLFMEAGVESMNLYDHNYWNAIVDPAFATWATENAGKRKVWTA